MMAPMSAMPPQDDENSGMSMQQVLSIIRAHRRASLIITLVIVVLTIGLAKIMPKTYVSTATLMVNYQTNDTVSAGGMQINQNYISTEMELMQTSEVLLPVIDQLKLAENPDYTAGYGGKNGTLRDYIKNGLTKDVEIEQGRAGSQLIYINASARDPKLAASIANSVVDVYLNQQRQRVHGPAGERAKNYSDELAELKQKVNIAQDQVTAFRQKSGVTESEPQAMSVEADLLSSLEHRYQDAQNARRAAEVAAAGEHANTSAVMGSAVVQTLKAQLNEQERALAQAQATMGPANPKIIALQSQIAATRASMRTEAANYSDNASSDLSAARQLEQKLAAAVAEQREKVLTVRKLQGEGVKYVLELESAQSVYKRALDGYDAIMFESGAHNTNVNLVSRAVPPVQAAKPNKIKLVMIGSIVGLLLGLAGPFGYELLLKRRVRCRDDFERGFGIPVLSEFDSLEALARPA